MIYAFLHMVIVLVRNSTEKISLRPDDILLKPRHFYLSRSEKRLYTIKMIIHNFREN
jgi:hypothetical protein